MESRDSDFLLDHSYEDLSTINNVNFTPREIDIIACLLSARGTNKIASFLSILPKTVRNHIHNIMVKLDCNSRDAIIDFVEHSATLPIFKKHYLNLIIQADFKKCLNELSKIKREKRPTCKIISYLASALHNSFMNSFEPDLKRVGIKFSVERQENSDGPIKLSSEPSNEIKNIYLLSNNLIENPKIKENFKNFKIIRLDKISLILSKDCGHTNAQRNINEQDFLELSRQDNYYFFILETLKNLLPYIDLEKLISEFKCKYEAIHSAKSQAYSETPLKKDNLRKSKAFFLSKVKNKKYILTAGLATTSIFFGGISLIFKGSEIDTKSVKKGEKIEPSIRSDLIIPTKSAFLNRSDLMDQIQKRLDNKEGIKAIALVSIVGIGGAGKTTLARQYAKMQPSPIVWEINAETKNTMLTSFEDLAYALAQSLEHKNEFNLIQKIQKSEEKEKKLILFLKRRLKEQVSWILIFDNMDDFSTMKQYLPQDPKIWGNGKVLITTRDSNIKNSGYITSNNVLEINALTPEQAITLFSKILFECDLNKLSKQQKEKAHNFLKNIPSFPLDISLAARYLKNAHTNYEEYLGMLQHNKNDFEHLQKTLLNQSSDYTRTRYGITSLSLKKIIDIHPEFKDFLILISLLDSQGIPVELLCESHDNPVVETFIYYLKKYSLASTNILCPLQPISILSMHRSTQKMSLDYLIHASNLDKDNTAIKKVVEKLENYLDKYLELEDAIIIHNIIRHFEKILTYDQLLNNELRYSLQIKLGNLYFYSHIGSYIKAKKFLEENIEFLKKEKDIKNQNNINDLIYLGRIYTQLDERKKIRDLGEYILLNYKNELMKQTSNVAWVLSFLGLMYSILGDYKKGIELLERSYVIYQNNFPHEHANIARTLLYLGNFYLKLGDYQNAEKKLNECYKIYTKNFSGNHYRIGNVLYSLSILHTYLGKNKESLLLAEKGYNTYKKYVSESYKPTIPITLGYIYLENGQYKKARNILEEGLKTAQSHFHEKHDTIARIQFYLGKVYMKINEYKNARILLEKSLKTFQENYGRDHLETAYVINDLSELNLLENKLNDSEIFTKEALSIYQKNNHPEIYKSLEMLAALYREKSILAYKNGHTLESVEFKEKSINFLHKALESIHKNFSKDSPHNERIKKKIEVSFQEGTLLRLF